MHKVEPTSTVRRTFMIEKTFTLESNCPDTKQIFPATFWPPIPSWLGLQPQNINPSLNLKARLLVVQMLVYNP